MIRGRWLFNNRVQARVQELSMAHEVSCLREQVAGWQRTALAMRDESIMAARTGVSRTGAIQRLYFDAALKGEFVPMEEGDAQD